MAELEREEIQNPTETMTTAKQNDIESKITAAMLSRINLFREKSDSLTFEGVRRVLEKELGMEEFSLDVHKRFVKDLLVQCLDHSAGNSSKNSGETKDREIIVKKEARESEEEVEPKTESKERGSEDEKRMEDSPVMGLLTGQGKTKQEPEESQAKENKVPNESTIKKALWKRASYIKVNLEKVTMAGLRRLLEEDLKLEKRALDPFKKFVSAQLDEILKSSAVAEPKKKVVKKISDGRVSAKRGSNKRNVGTLDKDSDEVDEDEDEEKQKKKPRQKLDKSELSEKRKRPEKETPEKETGKSGKKRTKPAEKVTDESSNAEEGENDSEDSHSKSAVKRLAKKKEALTPVYGKQVEHLKSIIKSCAMSVPPSIYRKVKQVPENKREAQLIKELEEILSREGLSSNPSEKVIKEVRKRKERAKELEGIDMSNIVSSSRRRSTTSYAPPPKPKMPFKSDEGADDSEEEGDDDDDDDDEADEIVDDDDGDNDRDHESESEEVDEEHDEESE